MKEIVLRLGRRALKVVAVLLVLFGVVKGADAIWFRTHIPVGFHDANWSGAWQTEQFGSFTGRLLVRLPDPLPKDEDFKAEALVYYPIYSGWNTGRFVKMDFTARFSPEGTSTAGESKNPIPGGGGKLKFKGIAGAQSVDYTAVIDSTKTTMVGAYLSKGPYDYGFFSIRYY